MKVDTEWQIGVLAVICNVIACTLLLITILIGIDVGHINMSVVYGLFVVYLITLIILFHFWVDKFNYIED